MTFQQKLDEILEKLYYSRYEAGQNELRAKQCSIIREEKRNE